jgi:hypothetical protein
MDVMQTKYWRTLPERGSVIRGIIPECAEITNQGFERAGYEKHPNTRKDHYE